MISKYLRESCVILDLKSSDKNSVIRELLEPLVSIAKVDRETLYEAIVCRESFGSTGVGRNIATPHAKVPFLSQKLAVLGISKEGVNFDSIDFGDVYFFLLVLVPINSSYNEIVTEFLNIFKNKLVRKEVYNATTKAEVINIIKREEPK